MAPVCVVVELNLPPFAYDRNAKDGRPAAAQREEKSRAHLFKNQTRKGRPPKISSPHEERPPAFANFSFPIHPKHLSASPTLRISTEFIGYRPGCRLGVPGRYVLVGLISGEAGQIPPPQNWSSEQ